MTNGTISLQEFIPQGWTIAKPYYDAGRWWAELKKDGEKPVLAFGSTMDIAIAMAWLELRKRELA